MRTGWVVAGVALFGCTAAVFVLFVIGSVSQQTIEPSLPQGSPESAFAVRVIKPRSARPLFGLMPTGTLGFDHKSRDAAVGRVGRDRLELTAEGWDLLVESDGAGKIAPSTSLVFELSLGGKDQRLRCKPADPAVGRFQSVPQGDTGEFGGTFEVKLATCENAASGYVINWPPRPLTLTGRFNRLAGAPAADSNVEPIQDP